MKIWIDIANSPHVSLFAPVVEELRSRGSPLLLTARNHAQTAELARERWPAVIVVNDQSPRGRAAKAAAIVRRAARLRALAAPFRPDVALSHGSYAQIIAARSLRIPAVTMMDYEHQPANHLSFRLASIVIVPDVFPSDRLRRCGAGEWKVRRYEGFKEELYLAGFEPSAGVLEELGIDPTKVLVVLRPPPSGALYHPGDNPVFDRLVEDLARRPEVEVVVLPRDAGQRARYAALPGVIVPGGAVPGLSLLAHADVAIGAGGTMNREAALLGTTTYTQFAGPPAAVDSRLIELGYLRDFRVNESAPSLTKRGKRATRASRERAASLLGIIVKSLEAASGPRGRRSSGGRLLPSAGRRRARARLSRWRSGH
jgi:uncharacterized protein